MALSVVSTPTSKTGQLQLTGISETRRFSHPDPRSPLLRAQSSIKGRADVTDTTTELWLGPYSALSSPHLWIWWAEWAEKYLQPDSFDPPGELGLTFSVALRKLPLGREALRAHPLPRGRTAPAQPMPTSRLRAVPARELHFPCTFAAGQSADSRLGEGFSLIVQPSSTFCGTLPGSTAHVPT